MTTFSEICRLWGSDRQLAEDTGQSEFTVQKWRQRNKISARHWIRIVEAAKKRGFRQVTLALLASIAASRNAA